jgi:predicted site-specific integrase-resolvase
MGFVRPDVSGKAVIYARVSSHDQKQKGDLERQKQSLLEYSRKAPDVPSFTVGGESHRSLKG